MAADPNYLAESVLSYYSQVERIVVSYDETSTSWTGTPIEVDTCLDILRRLDYDRKLVMAPGRYARLDHKPMENDTYQRQCALDLAGEGADWVLQIDTDEVIASPETFMSCLDEAERRGFNALDYPWRALLKQVGPRRYLENSTRFWRVTGGFPGAMAVRPGTKLVYGRQTLEPRFRADFRSTNTASWLGRSPRVHRVVTPDQAIYHYSWVRSEDYMDRKSRWSGHANDFNWNRRVERWKWQGRHPWSAVLRTPFGHGPGDLVRFCTTDLPYHVRAALPPELASSS